MRINKWPCSFNFYILEEIRYVYGEAGSYFCGKQNSASGKPRYYSIRIQERLMIEVRIPRVYSKQSQ